MFLFKNSLIFLSYYEKISINSFSVKFTNILEAETESQLFTKYIIINNKYVFIRKNNKSRLYELDITINDSNLDILNNMNKFKCIFSYASNSVIKFNKKLNLPIKKLGNYLELKSVCKWKNEYTNISRYYILNKIYYDKIKCYLSNKLSIIKYTISYYCSKDAVYKAFNKLIFRLYYYNNNIYIQRKIFFNIKPNFKYSLLNNLLVFNNYNYLISLIL
jgi:hypothetical protein